MKINFSLNFPYRETIREMSNAECIQAAIAAWDAGDYEASLAYVGVRGADEIWAIGPNIFLSFQCEPTGGNSPRPYKWTTKLIGDPRSCALADHILALGVI